MSTLFSKIRPIRKGGIPGERNKINELVDRVNWLCGIHTINGNPMSDTTTGPRIDLAQNTVPSGSLDQPWTIDPNGSSTGWTLITYLDASGNLWDMYVWSGIAFNERVCS